MKVVLGDNWGPDDPDEGIEAPYSEEMLHFGDQEGLEISSEDNYNTSGIFEILKNF